ncbi:MAG: M48 family metalloprotease [Gaiellaceae bacterium]
MRVRRLPWVALLAVLAVLWALAATQLWETDAPAGLRLPELDADDLFTDAELRRSSRYERFLRIDYLFSQAALLAVLALYAVRGHRLIRESAAGRIGTGMMLGMLGLALLWLVQLPFGLAALWWERRHGVSREGYLLWIVDNWLGLAGGFLFICLALLIVMALAGVLRDRWWIAGAPAFVGLAVLFAFVYPYLIPGLEPLRDRELAAQARSLATAQDVREIPVEVEDVGEYTTAPNAEATGLGPSRRVILWDTLLDGRFEDDEIRVVLAHELGHHAHEHIWKSLGWYALFAVPGTFLIAAATRRAGGMVEPRAVPLSLLVLVALQLIAQPVQNVISRRLEAEADWAALEVTRDPDAAKGLFQRFATTALQQPSPPTWSYVLLESHPTLMQRIAMAEAWRARRQPR